MTAFYSFCVYVVNFQSPKRLIFWLVGAGHLSVSLPFGGTTGLILLQRFSGVASAPGISRCLNAL